MTYFKAGYRIINKDYISLRFTSNLFEAFCFYYWYHFVFKIDVTIEPLFVHETAFY